MFIFFKDVDNDWGILGVVYIQFIFIDDLYIFENLGVLEK